MNLSIFEYGKNDHNKSIFEFENEILKLPQIPLEPAHYFAEGLYARELWMPAGSYITGKIHIKEHLCIISFGYVTVASDDEVVTLRGPCTFVGKPGSKRALIVHEDTLWTAIHSTDKKTVEECEETLVTNDYQDFVRICEEKNICLIG